MSSATARMKQCPQCKEVYADDSLNFCLADGSSLIYSLYGREEETVAFPPSQVVRTPPVVQRGVSPVFAYLAIGLLALLAGGGVAAWLLWDSTPTAMTNANNLNTTGATNRADLDRRDVNNNDRPANSRVSSPTPAAAVELDTAAATNEVTVSLNNWLRAVNNKDLTGRMAYYADRLDAYYTKRNVSREAVRNESKKAFDEFSELNMTISNLDVKVDRPTGKVVTTFDKTYDFRGDDRDFAGSVRSEFRWAKIGGRWSITSEKDLRVYSAK